eukprot:15464808-Alexandrium_andersonii.AAC.1
MAARHARPEDGPQATPPVYSGPPLLDQVYNLLVSLASPGETIDGPSLQRASRGAGFSPEVLDEALD